jgi:hypothetical protein
MDLMVRALAAAPQGDPDRSLLEYNLGSALLAQFERNGDAADIERAIELLAQAVDATPKNHPRRTAYAKTLEAARRARPGQPTAD